jgi:transcriptional regulator with XRE-family HTH domain
MGASRSKTLEEARAKLRAAAKESGMTLEEIGLAMGYSKSGARQAVSRLLNSSTDYDPRLTTLMQFAAAVNSSLSNILSS